MTTEYESEFEHGILIALNQQQLDAVIRCCHDQSMRLTALTGLDMVLAFSSDHGGWEKRMPALNSAIQILEDARKRYCR